MKPLSLQWRVLLLTGVVVATVPLFGLGIAVRERQQSGEREFRDSARSLSLALLPMLRNTLVVGDMATAQQAFDPIVRVGAVRRIALLRPADRQVMIESASEVAVEQLTSPPVWFRTLSGVHDHVEEFPVDVGGVGYGVLRLEMSDSAMTQEL